MRHAHEDFFLQKIESSEVKRNMETFKREKHVSKDKVDGVEMLADSYFYDLKVLHNGGQRAKAPVGRRPESTSSPTMERHHRERASPGELPTAASKCPSERLRDLGKELSADLRRHCTAHHDESSKISTIEQDLNKRASRLDPFGEAICRKRRERQELLAGIGGLFKSTVANKQELGNETDEQLGSSDAASEPREAKTVVEALPSLPASPVACKVLDSRCAQRDSKASLGREPAQRAATQRLAELVGFLIGCCGSVGAAFSTLDVNADHVLCMQEWEEGVQKLGFNDDVSYVFRLLGKGADGVATLDEVQALFGPFLKRSR